MICKTTFAEYYMHKPSRLGSEQN